MRTFGFTVIFPKLADYHTQGGVSPDSPPTARAYIRADSPHPMNPCSVRVRHSAVVPRSISSRLSGEPRNHPMPIASAASRRLAQSIFSPPSRPSLLLSPSIPTPPRRWPKNALHYVEPKHKTDYLFRWLEMRFLKGEQGLLFELPKAAQPQREVTSAVEGLGQVIELGDAPPCQFCGSLMVRNGSCYRCMTCGSTSGCS
jgi:hypothetical protein